MQDYRSTYNDIRDWQRRQKSVEENEKSTIDWDDVVFEVDLLKSQEINLDYILELVFEHNKRNKSRTGLVDEVRRVIRASLGSRAKERELSGGFYKPNRPRSDWRQGQRDRCVLWVCSSRAV